MFNRFSPHVVLKIYDKDSKLLGYLVIDSTINNSSCGGIRMHADLIEEEVRSLANAMTLKFGFLGLPKGGAKAGIIADPKLPFNRKMEKLQSFGRSLAPLLKNRIYIPGADLGTTEDDIRVICQEAGVTYKVSDAKSLSIYTGYTVYASVLASVGYLGLDPASCKIAIEGFGKVGSQVANILFQKDAKIVAVSTIDGAIYNPNGFTVPRLIAAKEIHGDSFIKYINEGEKISQEQLLNLDVDVLIPCAEAFVIHAGNAQDIRAKIVCPCANIPVTDEAERILFDRKILYVPDFIANSGGVLGSAARYVGLSHGQIENIINETFKAKIKALLERSEKSNVSLYNIAKTQAYKKFHSIKEIYERKGRARFFKGVASNLLRNMPFTKFMTASFASRWIRNMILLNP